MNRKSGFTLIELMVTLVIAAIVLTVGVPTFREVILNSRHRAQTDTFFTTLQSARSEAIKRGVQVTVCKATTATACNTNTCATNGANCWEKGWLVFVDYNGDGVVDTSSTPPDVILNIHEELTNSLTLRTTTNFANWIAYQPTGTSKGSSVPNGTFKICDSRGVDKARFIVVSTTGRIRVREKESGDTCP